MRKTASNRPSVGSVWQYKRGANGPRWANFPDDGDHFVVVGHIGSSQFNMPQVMLRSMSTWLENEACLYFFGEQYHTKAFGLPQYFFLASEGGLDRSKLVSWLDAPRHPSPQA